MKFLLIIFLLLPCVRLRAAEAVRLEALVAQALAENPELKFYEAEIAAAKGERRTAGAWANPEVSGEAGRKRVRGDVTAEGTAWAVSAQQSFEWPGRVSLRKAIAERQVQLAQAGLEQFRAALAAQVRRKAYALFAAQRREAAAQEAAGRGEELVANLVQREPAGVTPLVETRAVEAVVITRRRAATAAVHEAREALFELNQLRGRPIGERVLVLEVVPEFVEMPAIEELIRRAATGNFEMRQRELELAQQGFQVRLSENEAWPTITAGTQFSQEKAAGKETVAGLAVSLPLPLWNRNAGNIDVARAREMQARTSLRLAQREVERKLRTHAADYALHRKEMARWHPNVVEQLHEAASLADRHYRLGAVPLSTYLEVQSSYLEALEAIYATQADALHALAEIELLTGTKLTRP